MSNYFENPYPMDRLGVLLEQLQGLTAVGTQANYGELSEKEVRCFMYAVDDLANRCNAAYMDHHEAQTDARIREQAKEEEIVQ